MSIPVHVAAPSPLPLGGVLLNFEFIIFELRLLSSIFLLFLFVS